MCSSKLDERFLFATKQATRVHVLALDLQTSDRCTVLAYDETYPAESESGNYYRALPPSVALSARGDVLIYAAASGLFVLDPATGSTRALVVRTSPGDPEGSEPAEWRPKLKDVYGLVSPTVSSDGRFVSFEQGQYEGSELGLMGITGKPFEADLVHVLHPEWSSELSWASGVGVGSLRAGVSSCDQDGSSAVRRT